MAVVLLQWHGMHPALLRLDIERLHKHINYTKFLFDIIKASGLGEIVEDLITPKEK